jgi:hypothetical protein
VASTLPVIYTATASGGSVVGAMLGTSVHAAVMVVVTEIPRFSGCDQLSAPPAGHQPSFDEWCVRRA